MEINCVDNCVHQSEGKCGLTELSAGTGIGGGLGIDKGASSSSCLYYRKKKDLHL